MRKKLRAIRKNRIMKSLPTDSESFEIVLERPISPGEILSNESFIVGDYIGKTEDGRYKYKTIAV